MEGKMILVFFIVGMVLIGCNKIGAGSLGRFPKVTFSTYKINVEKAIDSLLNNYPEYKIPEKWKYKDNWSENGYDFLDGHIFYFSTAPEEMYYVTFLGDSKINATNSATIAVRAIIGKGGYWFLYDELSDEKKQKVKGRFYKEIISKLESITNLKSEKE